MSVIDRSDSSAPTNLADGYRPRIYYGDPTLRADPSDVPGLVGEAVALAFDSVLIPPPWIAAPDGDRFVPASLTRTQPRLGPDFIDRFVSACRRAGVRPMVDLPLGALAMAFDAETPGFSAQPTPDALDPRATRSLGRRLARNGPDSAAWWGAQVRRIADAGIVGVRLLGLDEVDTPPLIAAIRAGAPSLTLIAWTPGLPSEALSGLAGVDAVVSSLPWWDGQAAWLWDELGRLRAIAPVLACPEAPFGPRLAHGVSGSELLPAALRRAAQMAAALGDGWIVPAGFADGARRSLDRRGGVRSRGDSQSDIAYTIAALNHDFAKPVRVRGTQLLTGPGEHVLAVLRSDATDSRFATGASLHVVNTDLVRPATIAPARLLAVIDGDFEPFQAVDPAPPLMPGVAITLQPGSAHRYTTHRRAARRDNALAPATAQPYAAGARVAIEHPSPAIDDGTLPVKALVGEVVAVAADIICDGHDTLSAVLRWRELGVTDWNERRMRAIGNDRYGADLPLSGLGAYEYTIVAWRDVFGTYRNELAKKVGADLDVTLEVREGVVLVTRAAERAGTVRQTAGALAQADQAKQQAILLSTELAEIMAIADDRPRAATLPRPIRIDAERSGAAFAAWYEAFPRSLSDDPARHGSFADVERHLPRIKAMGFDVLYFPPIHPIGRTNRKGANNTLTPCATDPGSPYAIGGADGGHEAIHPELGDFAAFEHLLGAAAEHGLEVAIDFAIQCSPDHPWLREHRDWFEWRPDGSIRYAENPPKKYQDIVNVDFYAGGAIPALWVALANVVLFWCRHGVRLFRVDNPHTKPLPFWQWMIAEVRARYPDAVFLAEAFTRPKVMYRLAKVGFSQSYTYFTWRESKRELEAYVTELAQPGPRDFFRPHFFVNTPDINPVYLQNAPRSAYVIRAALAALLSGLWGVYSGFELCEGTPVPGREEYLDSEKYQLRAWDWDRPGHIVDEITTLNRLRRSNPALRSHLNTVFLPAGNDRVSVFEKATPDRGNAIIAAISFDPHSGQDTQFEFPFWHWQLAEQDAFDVEDLITGARSTWRGKAQFARLTPDQPYAVWRIRPASRT